LNGDRAFYDKLLATLKNAKSPEEYYMALFALPRFGNLKLLQRTLDYAISPDVRSQDALRLISDVMRNPAGEKLAWDFVLAHWDAVQKAGGPFASAEIVYATSSFLRREYARSGCEFFRCAQDRRSRNAPIGNRLSASTTVSI
jgi:aminopeptidase N